jgi:hypothetical protein
MVNVKKRQNPILVIGIPREPAVDFTKTAALFFFSSIKSASQILLMVKTVAQVLLPFLRKKQSRPNDNRPHKQPLIQTIADSCQVWDFILVTAVYEPYIRTLLSI